MKERERAMDAETARLHSRLGDVADDTGRKLAQSEMKLREEHVERFSALEKVLIFASSEFSTSEVLAELLLNGFVLLIF